MYPDNYMNPMNNPITCLEEAKAARIALDGSMSVFVNIQDGEIYTHQFKKILSCACTESSFRGEYASSADSNRNYCLSGLYPHR